MLLYSLAVVARLHARGLRSPRDVTMFHVADTAGVLLVLVSTGGAVSPFSTLFLFVLLAAGYRWGQLETWVTAATGVGVLGAHGVFLRLFQGSSSPDLHVVALRLAYTGIGGVLIGYMAETERVQRHSAWLVSRLLSRVRAEGGAVAAVQAVMDELMRPFRATHGVLAFDEDGSGRVALWHAEREGGPSSRVVMRLSQALKDAEGIYSFPVPPAADAFKVRRPGLGSPPDSARVVALGARDARVGAAFSVAPLLSTPFVWQTAFCVSVTAGEGWTGRLFLFMPHDPVAPRDQLKYLRGIVQQVGPALFNVYLQRRLTSRAGVADRARISRELHDGIIQALIGIEMQLEVLRREAAGKVPEQVASQLATIQRLLSEEILDVRDLMRLLKPEAVDATRLVEHLADMVERFRHRTSIQARLVCDADEIDLTPRACREVGGIVQEALANVRKHSGATSVVVRLERTGVNWTLTVDDNGCGLDFEGHLTPAEVEAQRKGPVIIKERVRAIGGSLALRSHRGSGTQIEVTIPAKHYA
jgi:signal transduction histidine kinase